MCPSDPPLSADCGEREGPCLISGLCWAHHLLKADDSPKGREWREVAESMRRPLVCPDCDSTFCDHRGANAVSTVTACLCGEWTPEKLYTGCGCISPQKRCVQPQNFSVRLITRKEDIRGK